MTDEMAQTLGFADAEEFHRMVANADMRSPAARAAFKDWQENDGTKAGLEKLQEK